jgi:hypothetical protein
MQVGYIDDRFGPLGLAGVVVLALSAILVISLVDFAQQMHKGEAPAGAPPPLAASSSATGALLDRILHHVPAPAGRAPHAPSLRSAPFGAVLQAS